MLSTGACGETCGLRNSSGGSGFVVKTRNYVWIFRFMGLLRRDREE